ncbi:MAG: hypothetical protein NXI32_05840, partial [bacterium]|nr:hypothetical protein [bacterium]
MMCRSSRHSRELILTRPRDMCRLRRAGATVLEVMFAIFVVIVGLMGIASLIPLAARNAEQSNAYNQSLAQGQIWLNDFLARGLNRPNSFTRRGSGFNWQWYNDTAFTTGNNVPVPIGFYNFSKRGIQNTPGNVIPNSFLTPTNSAVTSLAGARIWAQQSVCIDPVFMSDPDVIRSFNTGAARYNGYRASVFPYYEDGHNPIEDGFAPATNAWPDQPRMLRVTLGGNAGQIPNKLVKDLFVSRDDVATFISDDDKTIPASRLFSQGAVKSLTTGDYTWMATLTPEPVPTPSLTDTTTDYVLSLVILQRRDRQYLAPGTSPPPGQAESKPQGERLVWVQPLSGDFRGGNGGRVRLLSNQYVEDRVHVGDWIL